jgi:AraC-like DNA-binding protein
MQGLTGEAITVRFALPAPELRPFVTTYYRTDISSDLIEPLMEDYFHPEWPNLRFVNTHTCRSAIGGEEMQPTPRFTVTGPTSRATKFAVNAGRIWGIGLMPLGWAKFVAAEAGDFADRAMDGRTDPVFEQFYGLDEALAKSSGDFADELALIEQHMAPLVEFPLKNSEAISVVNEALVDPDIDSVADLAERVGMNVRSLERLSRRAFGFTPKLLLRRQRFLRSLSQFMLDPSMKWLNTLDYHYHDQAHFVRDFKRFMGMAPSAYAKLDKPFLVAAARGRMAIAGEAVQGLHHPEQETAQE